MNSPKLVLASQSPRRNQFFQKLGIQFRAQSADIDETPLPNESPQELVERLALVKALAVGNSLTALRAQGGQFDWSGGFIVVGADTVVAVDGDILGKPEDSAESFAMLRRLRGRAHHVHTALAVAHFEAEGLLRAKSRTNTTEVSMRPYTESEIAAYIATGDPADKAGAYAIQHRQFHPVTRLSGCPAAVMGLPLADLLHLLADFDMGIGCKPNTICPALTGLQCCQSLPES